MLVRYVFFFSDAWEQLRGRPPGLPLLLLLPPNRTVLDTPHLANHLPATAVEHDRFRLRQLTGLDEIETTLDAIER